MNDHEFSETLSDSKTDREIEERASGSLERVVLRAQVERWRDKAKAFENRSSCVEGPMDDILTSKALTLRSCALDIEDILDQAQNS